jgi:hypothetical protein
MVMMQHSTRAVSRSLTVVALVSALASVGACAKARAEAAPDGPPLQMP